MKKGFFFPFEICKILPTISIQLRGSLDCLKWNDKEGIESVPSITTSTRVRHPFLTAPMKNSCCSIATELLADRAYLWRSFSWRLQERTTTLSLALARFFCGRMSIHDLLYVSWEVNETLITTTLWRGESCASLAIKLILQLLHFSWKEIFNVILLIQCCFFVIWR